MRLPLLLIRLMAASTVSWPFVGKAQNRTFCRAASRRESSRFLTRFLRLASRELDGSPFCSLPDELLQQHVKGVPEQAVTLLHQRVCLFLCQGGTTQRDTRFQDDTLGVGDGLHQFGGVQLPGYPSSVDRSNGAMVRQSIPSTWQISSMLSTAARVSISSAQTVSSPRWPR